MLRVWGRGEHSDELTDESSKGGLHDIIISSDKLCHHIALLVERHCSHDLFVFGQVGAVGDLSE
jgi:hypothetical protein